MTDPKHPDQPQTVQSPNTSDRQSPDIKRLAPYIALSALAIGGGLMLLSRPKTPEVQSSTGTSVSTSTVSASTMTEPPSVTSSQTGSDLSAASGPATVPAPRSVRDPFVAEQNTDNPLNPSATSAATASGGNSDTDTTGTDTTGTDTTFAESSFSEVSTPSVTASTPAVTARVTPPSTVPSTPVTEFTPTFTPAPSTVSEPGKPLSAEADTAEETVDFVLENAAAFTPAPVITLSPEPQTNTPTPSFSSVRTPAPAPARPQPQVQPEDRTQPPAVVFSPVPLPDSGTDGTEFTIIMPSDGGSEEAVTTPAAPITTGSDAQNPTQATVLPETTSPANAAELFVQENAVSFRGLARNEDGTKTLLLGSRYGPVYVESGKIINGTKATVALKDEKSVTITVGNESTTLKLEQ